MEKNPFNSNYLTAMTQTKLYTHNHPFTELFNMGNFLGFSNALGIGLQSGMKSNSPLEVVSFSWIAIGSSVNWISSSSLKSAHCDIDCVHASFSSLEKTNLLAVFPVFEV